MSARLGAGGVPERKVPPTSVRGAAMRGVVARPGREAVEAKGWLRAHKWLLLRRASQLGILALFLVGPWLGWWIVKGNLSSSLTLGVLPLTDPFLVVQQLAAGHWPLPGGAARRRHRARLLSALRWAAVLLVGVSGQPRHRRRRLVAPAAGPQGWQGAVGQHALLAARLRAGHRGGDRLAGVGVGESGVDVPPRPDLRFRTGLGASSAASSSTTCSSPRAAGVATCARKAPSTPCSDAPPSSRSRPPSAARATTAWTASPSAPSPQVIRPALKGVGQDHPLILDADCTTCGRCVDVCGKDVFRITTRFNRSES